MKSPRFTLAIRVAIFYLLFSGLWIFASDRVAAALVKNAAGLTTLQTYKGLGFILISGLIFYFYVARENRLREGSQQDFSNLFEYAVEGIFQSTPEGRYIKVNPAAAQIYGYSTPEEMVASITDISRQIHVNPGKSDEFIKAIMQDGYVENFEAQNYRKDGSIIWTSSNVRLVRDKNGNPLYFEGFVTDITENKAAEQKIEASEDQYRRLVEHSPYAIAVHSERILVYVNQAAVRLIGANSADEMIGTSVINFAHPDSRPEILKRFRQMEQGLDVPPVEEKFLRQDGSVVWVETTAFPFTYQNKPAVQVVIRDLTEQKKAEEAIRASEERFSKAFRSSPIPTCITTVRDGYVVDVNEAYLRLSKWRREEVVGLSIDDLNIYSSPEDRLDFVEKLTNRKIVQGEESAFMTATGEQVEVACYYELINVEGQVCVLSMFLDLTEQRQSQEIIRASEERLRAIVDHTKNIYYSHTPDHTVTYLSAQTKDILGYDIEEASKKWQELLTDHPINQRGIELTQQAIDTGIAQEPYILELKAKDGSHVWVEVRETPVVRDGKTIAVVGALTDITDRKKAEENLERRLAELTVLHAVALAGSQSTQEDDVIKRTTQIVSGMLYPDSCGVLLLNEKGTALQAHSSYWGLQPEFEESEIPILQGISGQVASSGKTQRLDDVSLHPDYVEAALGIRSELCTPIRVNDRIIGVLNVESRKLCAFDREDERVVNTIAGTLGTALERIRLFAAEQKQRQQAENLREATAALTKTIDLEQLFEVILDSLSRLVAYVSASIETVDGEYIEIVAARGLPDEYQFVGKRTLLRPERWKVDILKPMVIPDVTKDERFERIEGTEYIRSWMGVPMIARNHLLGYLNLDSDQIGYYTEEQAALVQTFANQAATAIENARSFQAEKKRRREAENLQVAATAITSTLKVEEVLETILIALKQVTSYDSASVSLLEGDHVRIRAGKGLPKPDLAINRLFPADNGLLLAIQKDKGPIIVEDAQQDPRFKKWAAADNVHGWLGVPLIARGEIIGYITLDSYTVGAFKQGDAVLAQAFANQAAVALDNASLFQSLAETNEELTRAYDTTLEGWGNALELRDKETQGHTKRVTELTLRLARQLGLQEPELTYIRRGVLVHDIGKMGVPDVVLNKKGPLTKKEWTIMRKHPRYAFELLYPIPYLRPSLDIPYSHHERWDGSGYPQNLRAEQIPLPARIFAVVDVWDALLSNRPYRRAWSRKRAEKYIQEQAGTHFDPHIVDVFLKMITEKEET